MKIEVHDGSTVKVFRVKAVDELTVREWLDVVLPPIPEDDPAAQEAAIFTLLERHTTISRDVLMRMSMGQARQALDAIAKLVDQMNTTSAHAKRIAKQWRDDGPKEWKWEGVTYVVPQDLEQDTTFEQWVFLQGLLSRVQFEAQATSAVCAALLLPKGEVFNDVTAMERVAMYDNAPAVVPLRITAFFLSRNEPLRNSVQGCMNSITISKMRSAGLAPSDTMHATASGA